MNSGPAKNYSRSLVNCLYGLGGLVAFGAAMIQILDWAEVKPGDVRRFAQTFLGPGRTPAPKNLTPSGPQSPPKPLAQPAPPPAPKRPVQLVLILGNEGDNDNLKSAVQVASKLAGRLTPEDSVSLIDFGLDQKHHWVFRDKPGDQSPAAIRKHTELLLPISRIRLQPAVDEALQHLQQDRKPGANSAVVVLTGKAGEDGKLNAWLERIKSDAEARELVLNAPEELTVQSR